VVDATASDDFLKDGARADISRDVFRTLGQVGHKTLAVRVV